jgi:TetR/AcrR family transcriptional repressor of nem operon
MRYDAAHKDRTRDRIVETASRRFRAEGIASVGIGNLMSTAGLTHGGFYAHFPSKDDLVIETCHAAFAETLSWLSTAINSAPAGKKLRAMVDTYLVPLHRERPDRGCFGTALASEIARMPKPVREALTDRIGALVELASVAIEADESEKDPKAVVAMMVGALTIARVVTNKKLAEDYLAAARRVADPDN